MVAVSPRITFTPSPEAYRAITRLAEVQGSRASLVVREMMDGVSPHLDQLAEMLEKVVSARLEADQSIAAAARLAAEQIAPHAQAATDLFRMLSDAVSSQPPYCNTGVTVPGALPAKPRRAGSAK